MRETAIIAAQDAMDREWRENGRMRATAAFDAIVAELGKQDLVMRDDGGVIHEIRGAPKDVFRAMLAAIAIPAMPTGDGR